MRFLVLLPVLSALVAPSLTAPTAEAASPEKFDSARNGACTQTPPWGEKTDGRIDQFRKIWKDREARGAGTKAASKSPPPPPPKSKMDTLVDNAEGREHGKYTSPKPYSEMKPTPPAKAPPARAPQGAPPKAPQGAPPKAPQGAPPKAPQGAPPRAPQGAPAKAPKRKARNPAKGLERLEKRNEGFCRAPELASGNKYPESDIFFQFAEDNLGVRYNQKDLESARAKLESSLAAAAQRNAERNSDDPPPVQCDEEFLAFAGIQREDVAPPARDEFQHEAKKSGFDKFEGIPLRKTVATEGQEAQEKQKMCLPHNMHGCNMPQMNPHSYQVPCTPATPATAPISHTLNTPSDSDIDLAIMSAETESIIILIEDIQRFIIFFDLTRNDDVLVGATKDVPVELNFEVLDPNALNSVTPTNVNGVAFPSHVNLAQDEALTVQSFRPVHPGLVADGACGTAAGSFATGLGANGARNGRGLGANVGLFPGGAQELPLDLATAHAQRKQFDIAAEKSGPWCPISDDAVLEFLRLAV